MNYVNMMYQTAQDYWQHVPQNTGQEMAYACVGVFIVETIFTGNVAKGAAAGALSALATAIHGLVTPLFQKFIQGRHQLTWGEEMCRTFTAIIGAGCVASALGNNSIFEKLFFLAILHGLIIHYNPARGDLNRADWIPVFPNYHHAKI